MCTRQLTLVHKYAQILLLSIGISNSKLENFPDGDPRSSVTVPRHNRSRGEVHSNGASSEICNIASSFCTGFKPVYSSNKSRPLFLTTLLVVVMSCGCYNRYLCFSPSMATGDLLLPNSHNPTHKYSCFIYF